MNTLSLTLKLNVMICFSIRSVFGLRLVNGLDYFQTLCLAVALSLLVLSRDIYYIHAEIKTQQQVMINAEKEVNGLPPIFIYQELDFKWNTIPSLYLSSFIYHFFPNFKPTLDPSLWFFSMTDSTGKHFTASSFCFFWHLAAQQDPGAFILYSPLFES